MEDSHSERSRANSLCTAGDEVVEVGIASQSALKPRRGPRRS